MRRVMIASFAALSLVFAACTPDANDGGGEGGGIFRIGTPQDFDTLNPFAADNYAEWTVLEYIYPQLVQLSQDTREVVGDFATEWASSDDGLTLTFTLRSGATWTDGEPLTADDAAWTINTIKEYSSGPAFYFAVQVANIKEARAIDARTLEVRYSQVDASALESLARIWILPEHVWGPLVDEDPKQLRRFPNTPPTVTAGPFTLASFEPRSSVVLEKNPDWYGDAPHVDRVGIQFFSNPDSLVAALRSNQIDFIDFVPPTTIDSLSDSATTFEQEGLIFRYLSFNSNPAKAGNRELLDPAVRQAIAHAVDRDAINETVWLGKATAGSSIISQTLEDWVDPSIAPQTFDLNLADQILDEAGYDKGADGIRVADGHPMSYEIIAVTYDAGISDRMFDILVEDFRAIGIDVKFRAMDELAFLDELYGPNYDYPTFDMALWSAPTLPDPGYILAWLTCGQYGFYNDTGYCDEGYDAMFRQQSTALDPDERRQIVFEMQRKSYEDSPYIVIAWEPVLQAVSSAWTGLESTPLGAITYFSKEALINVRRA